jgi:hypothetical protein
MYTIKGYFDIVMVWLHLVSFVINGTYGCMIMDENNLKVYIMKKSLVANVIVA